MSDPKLIISLGKLLNYIAEVSTIARMYTAYNSSNLKDPNAPVMTMYLTSMLHNLDELGLFAS